MVEIQKGSSVVKLPSSLKRETVVVNAPLKKVTLVPNDEVRKNRKDELFL